MCDDDGGKTKKINGEDVQVTASESKIGDKPSSNKHSEVHETTKEKTNTESKELEQKNEETEKLGKKADIKLGEKQVENKKDCEIKISDVNETDKKSEDTVKVASNMSEKQEKEVSIRPEEIREKKVSADSDQRKSIFKDGQSKSDVQENKDKKIQSKSYVKEGEKTPQQSRPIIKDTQNRSAEAGSEHKEKKVHIVIDAEEKSAAMKSGSALKDAHPSSDEDSDTCNVKDMMNGKVKDEEMDNTACESDVDSDKDCMLDIKDMDHACDRDENRSKSSALFGLSLSKLLRRRYIVVLGILLGGCMLGIILFGVIHAAMDPEEMTMTTDAVDTYGLYSSTEYPTDVTDVNNDDDTRDLKETESATSSTAITQITNSDTTIDETVT